MGRFPHIVRLHSIVIQLQDNVVQLGGNVVHLRTNVVRLRGNAVPLYYKIVQLYGRVVHSRSKVVRLCAKAVHSSGNVVQLQEKVVQPGFIPVNIPLFTEQHYCSVNQDDNFVDQHYNISFHFCFSEKAFFEPAHHK